MNKLPLLFLPLLLASCHDNAGRKTHEMSATLKEMQVELAELKYLVNNHQMELSIMDERITEEDKAIAKVKKELTSSDVAKKLHGEFEALKKRVTHLDKQHEKSSTDLKKLATHAEQTSSTLSQYKARLEGIQKNVSDTSKRLDEVKKLKGTLTSINEALNHTAHGGKSVYRVQPGDSLGGIAHKNKTSVSAIKRANGLEKDTIIPGQELIIPAD